MCNSCLDEKGTQDIHAGKKVLRLKTCASLLWLSLKSFKSFSITTIWMCVFVCSVTSRRMSVHLHGRARVCEGVRVKKKNDGEDFHRAKLSLDRLIINNSRRVDSSALDSSLSSHQHSYI